MPGNHSPGLMSTDIRLRDVLLLTLFAPICSAALQQQQPNKARNNAYESRNSLASSLDDAAAAVIDRRYDAAVDSLNTQSSGQRGYFDTSPFRKNNDKKVQTPTNERALATVSPAESDSAVRAPPASRSSTATDGLTSRQPARHLQDWQVEDIILLATVDGSLHARDRNNFASRWQLGSDSPMVETTYHRRDKTVDETGQELEDPLWIVEPSQDGSIYVYAPTSGFGMQKLGYTVKQLAELAPYASDGEPAVAYTAEKKTTLYTVDAATGNILKAFSSTGAVTNNDRSCRRVNPLVAGDTDEECERIGTIMLGRTEYTIGIQDRNSGEQISTIRYAEWSANNRDQDLRNKYTQTKDNNYVYTRHDGTVFRLSAKKSSRASLHHKFSSPVAQVFDVFRASDDNEIDPTLIVLPQPAAPPLNDYQTIDDEYENVFVNCTEAGSWYALSEMSYPDITHEAPTAKCYLELHLPTLPLTKRERKLFTGVHPIASNGRDKFIDGSPQYPAIGAPPPSNSPSHAVLPITQSTPYSPVSWQSIFVLLLAALVSIGTAYGYKQQKPSLLVQPHLPAQQDVIGAASAELLDSKHMVREDEPARETIFAHTTDGTPDFILDDAQGEDDAADGNDDTVDNPKKKKATRGKRGGRKQKEKDAAAAEARAKRLGLKVPEPVEVISVAASESPQVSGPLQINSLVIHTDKVIGQGSCGTCVFEGSFEGRGVAVKRMLSQYYELASQEVSFLQQSDDHENVIRYYCQQKDDHFLYIAVELCQASLFEVWEAEKAKTEERQLQLRRLKSEIQQDVPRTLQQLAKGLHHLHKLRIIHRDIKPQNILVAFPKKFVDDGPRLVISDFGLGKNLPENVSTLIDPTGNAGTSGWKAPELISQPQAESRHSQGNSQGPHNHDSNSNTTGLPSGVKRAADIFSLGCLFFWMLTDGIHPFEDDNGWTQLRELNIKRGLKKMEMLERWSDAYEPMQLISSMLEHEPEHRPTALQVLNHPFFWSSEKRLAFLCDVSDHYEREPRGVWEDGWSGDSMHLRVLERHSREVVGNGNNFLARLDRIFVDTLGKQRKYSGDRLLDLLRALRNKKNHYEDMSEDVKKRVGPLAAGYLTYWTDKFPRLLMACYGVIHECGVESNDRFKGYFE